jgi:hypothetical protein
MAYHRMAHCTGFGNPNKCLMNNEWSKNESLNSVIKEMLHEAIGLWFKDYDGCDFGIGLDNTGVAVMFGIEPSYQYDPLKVYTVFSNNMKDESYYQSGKAWGSYGTDIAKHTRMYRDFKKQSKFTRFVDEWSVKLTEAL